MKNYRVKINGKTYNVQLEAVEEVSGSITTPSTAGVHYLWIEGDVKDNAGSYMSNSTNISSTISDCSKSFTFSNDVSYVVNSFSLISTVPTSSLE